MQSQPKKSNSLAKVLDFQQAARRAGSGRTVSVRVPTPLRPVRATEMRLVNPSNVIHINRRNRRLHSRCGTLGLITNGIVSRQRH